TLNSVDAGITMNSNAINAIANALTSQIINDPEKYASIAAAYALKQMIDTTNINLNNKADLKYQIIDLNSADLITLPLGRWAVNNGLAGGEAGGWFAEVVQYDDAFVSLLAIPYDGTKKYFYRAKKTYGVWRGWEKYTSAT
ncbi:MAG: hypothetical protein ACRC36_14505, partial [Lacrimispora sphenoides]